MITMYYRSYEGPELTSCSVGNEDLTVTIRGFYGKEKRWKNTLNTYGELFGKESLGKTVKMTFRGDDGRTHWFYDYVHNLGSYCLLPKALGSRLRL